jgi:hypothetical protein
MVLVVTLFPRNIETLNQRRYGVAAGTIRVLAGSSGMVSVDVDFEQKLRGNPVDENSEPPLSSTW